MMQVVNKHDSNFCGTQTVTLYQRNDIILQSPYLLAPRVFEMYVLAALGPSRDRVRVCGQS